MWTYPLSFDTFADTSLATCTASLKQEKSDS